MVVNQDGAGERVPPGHQIIGKWYYGLDNGQYIRYQFTEAGAYSYSNPFKMVSGTFTVQGDQLTLRPSDGAPERFTFRFECIGRGSFSEYITLKSTDTLLETPFVRDPTDPGQRCM